MVIPHPSSGIRASVPMIISRRNPCLYCVFFALLSFHLAEGFFGSLSCLSLSSRHETALNSVEPAEKSYGKGAWKPPSQNKEQQRGNIFSIQQPQDLLDFVVEDERLSVVKVFASWCKTCQVFDLRYRKLANQYRDTTKDSITNYGRVRFAEMQYDNPNNEEMCQLLNATKLPYILMYKGSSGKVDEFQCGPGNFQLLIDKVREYADSEEEIAAFKMDSQTIVTQSELQLEQTTLRQPEQQSDQSTTSSIPKKQQIHKVVSSTQSEDRNLSEQTSNDIDSLREQLITANNEKNDLFEVMKADLDWHQDQIRKLNKSLKAQHDQYEGLLRSRDEELTNNKKMIEEKQKQFDVEVLSLKRQLDELSNTTQQSKQKIQSLEAEVHYWQRQAEMAVNSEGQTRQLIDKVAIYESERNSLRKLSFLALKRVWRGAGSIVCKLRRK